MISGEIEINLLAQSRWWAKINDVGTKYCIFRGNSKPKLHAAFGRYPR